MQKTSLKRVGKIGEANIEARKRIAAIAEEDGLNYCEIQLKGCLKTWPLSPAHRHKRSWYKGNVEHLSNYNQWVVACQNCHNLIEHDAELTDAVFNRLRPIS